jgi:hypothetical protein
MIDDFKFGEKRAAVPERRSESLTLADRIERFGRALTYELLFSFLSPEEKNEFLNLIRSNEDMGNDYIIELTPPTTEQLGMLAHSQRSYPMMPSLMPC